MSCLGGGIGWLKNMRFKFRPSKIDRLGKKEIRRKNKSKVIRKID